MSQALEDEGSGDSRLACVTVLYLESLHEDARGFKRGFMGTKYGYLSPAQFDVAIRFDVRLSAQSACLRVCVDIINFVVVGVVVLIAGRLWPSLHKSAGSG